MAKGKKDYTAVSAGDVEDGLAAPGKVPNKAKRKAQRRRRRKARRACEDRWIAALFVSASCGALVWVHSDAVPRLLLESMASIMRDSPPPLPPPSNPPLPPPSHPPPAPPPSPLSPNPSAPPPSPPLLPPSAPPCPPPTKPPPKLPPSAPPPSPFSPPVHPPPFVPIVVVVNKMITDGGKLAIDDARVRGIGINGFAGALLRITDGMSDANRVRSSFLCSSATLRRHEPRL